MLHPGLLIAIVDDDASVRKGLQRLLRSAAIGAETFESGEAFMEAFPVRKYDCLVLDLHLPGLNGLEVVNSLTDRHFSLPVILITAHDQPGVSDEARAGGVAFYLRKPVNDQTLLRAIDAAIEGFALPPHAGAVGPRSNTGTAWSDAQCLPVSSCFREPL